MIDDNRKNLSLEDYKTLKEALREQTQNWDIDVQWDEWLKTEWKDIENWVDSKAVKDFQSRILKIENEEKNVGKVAWKKVSKSVADAQQRAVETKREKLIEEIKEYYWLDQYEAANKYDELRDSANVNNVKYQTADEPNIRELTLNNTKKEWAYDPRASLPNPRWWWTKAKIEKQLKEPLTSEQRWVRAALRAIQEFDNADDFKAHTFYHGTQGSFVWKPTMSIPEKTFDKMADQFWWWYWERYWAISLTTDKKIASNFWGASDHVNINPVILRKNAKVIEMPELSDSVELADHIEQLWNDWVDAVWIWDKYSWEKELAVLNPKAIVNLDAPDHYRQYHLWWEDNPLRIKSDADFDTIYENASKYKQELSELDSKAIELRENFFKDNYGKSQFKLMDEDFSKYKEAKQAWENSSEKVEYDKLKSDYNRKLYEVKDNIRYQKYWTAWEWEKWVNAIQWLNIRNFKNWKSVKELADNYWIKTNIVQSISTPEWQKAYWMYWDRVITLARDLKESTVPHELLHATFDMVDQWKKNQILDGIKERLKVDDVQAEEWLADNFSEYYRTGKFDTKAIPTTFVWQIKQFFQQIKEYIDWTYANRKEIQNLFDDIIDGKLEWEYWYYSDPRFQTVWHWSHAIFDKFDSSHMWEWEWAQAHWWWHYVAVDENTSRRYAWLKSWIEKPYEYDWKTYKEMINERNSYSNMYESRKLSEIISLIDEWENSWGKSLNEVLDNRKKFINQVLENDKKTLANKSKWTEQYVIDNLNQFIENDEELLWILDGIDVDKINKIELPKNNHLYEVDIPDPKKADTPTGSNYLEEDGAISKKELEKINNELLKREWYWDLDYDKNLKPVSDMTKEDIENIVKKADKWIYDKVLQEKGIAERRFQTSFSTLWELFDTQLRWRIPLDDYVKLLTEAWFKPDLDFVYWKNWREVYRSLEKVLWSDKKASKFLESLWYDWIHYFWGKDWECYVIFNDDSLDMKNREDF